MPASELTVRRSPVRLRSLFGLSPPLAGALAVLVVAWVALVATHPKARPALSAAGAVRIATADPSSRAVLARVRFSHFDVTALDSRTEFLGLYRGSRLVATVTIGTGRKPTVEAVSDLTKERYAFGSGIANDERVLAGVTCVFLLMTAVWPVWRLRNLDAVAVASLVLSVVLFNRWLVGWAAIWSSTAIGYLALRSAWWALAPRRAPQPAVPLLDALTHRWDPGRRLRLLRMIALACGLIVAMVGLSSPHVLDVGYAVMEGATAIVHGVLPYGHVPGVFHGDTYPLGSYLLYAPAAWLSPVRTVFDNADATLVVAVAAALLAAWGMARIGGGARRPAPDPLVRCVRLRTAIMWMTFPPLLVTVSTGTTDVALAAMLVAALVLWRRPTWSTTALSGAAWFKLAPVAALPLWLARYRGRALARALLSVAAISVAMLVVLVALGGWGAPGRMFHALAFQFTRSSPHTLWALVGSFPLQQAAQALTLALIAGATIAIRRDRTLADDLPRMAALSGAVLLALQFSASYWNYMYLVWVMPFLIVSLLAGAPRSRLEVAVR